MTGLGKAFQIAFRSLRRRPLISLVAVLTLALGIGAGTAVYTVLHATLLRPLPYFEPDRLVAVWGVLPAREIDEWPASPSQVEFYRQEARRFEDFAGYIGNRHVFQRPETSPEQIDALTQTWNLFQLLGVEPFLGRDFNRADASFNSSEVPPGLRPPNNVFNPPSAVILSFEFWQSRFGSDPGVLGTTVYLDENPAQVVGVMPRGFRPLLHGGANADPDLYEALRIDTVNAPLENVFLSMVARLKPETTPEQAQEELDAMTAVLAERAPILKTNRFTTRLVPLREEVTRDIRAMVWILAGSVGIILLIVCANVANLLLIRASERRSEAVIRSALGASRKRLVLESLLETGLLALAGAGLGVVIATATLPGIIALQPQQIPQLIGLQLDYSILAFVVGTAGIVTLLAGGLPALLTANQSKGLDLRQRGVSVEDKSSHRWRNLLVVGEVALSFVLLVGAGLMLRSFYELRQMDPGFNPEGVLAFTYTLPPERYPDPTLHLSFNKDFKTRISALPGVQAVGGINPLPLTGANFGSRYAPDLTTFTDGSARQAQYRPVYPGYFEAVRTPVLAGRTFEESDQETVRSYAVINQALAERTWPDESPIGKRLYVRGATPDPRALEVIGVVADQKQASLDEEPVETVYFLNSFSSEIGFGPQINWTVRMVGDPKGRVGEIETVLEGMDRQLALQGITTLKEIVAASTASTRFAMTLIGIFSLLATFLAAVGLYGLLAYRVRQRRPELGIRLTFGASPGEIFGLVLKQGLLLVVIGLAIGVLAGLAVARVMSSMLVGVTATDPLTYAAIFFFFGVVAGLACLLPARRATRVDPAAILRQE